MCKSVSSSSVHGTDMRLHRRPDEQTVLVTAVIVVWSYVQQFGKDKLRGVVTIDI